MFFGDPTCILKIHGRPLRIPLSHMLPVYLKEFQFYDRLPKRISEYIHSKKEKLINIDVGANIGDTISALSFNNSDVFLAIEPYPKFYELLVQNWGSNKNVMLSNDICSNKSGEFENIMIEQGGTASISSSPNRTLKYARTLDDIIKDYPEISTSIC